MPGDPKKKLKRGDRIPAEAFNFTMDAAREYRERSARTGAGSVDAFRQTGIVLVRNDSGADRGEFDVLGIAGVLIAPADDLAEFKTRVLLSGVTPVLATHGARFAILLEPLADGAIGKAVVSGVTVGRVHVTTAQLASPPTRAEIDDTDASRLALSDDGPAEVLWQETLGSQGDASAVLRLGNSAPVPPPVAFSGARVYHNATQTIAAGGVGGTYTLLAFNSERWDTDAYHDNTTNNSRLTVPADGYYHVGCSIQWDGLLPTPANWIAGIDISAVNGGSGSFIAADWRTVYSSGSGVDAIGMAPSVVWPCSAGDFFVAYASHTRGAAATVLASSSTNKRQCEFWIQKVG